MEIHLVLVRTGGVRLGQLPLCSSTKYSFIPISTIIYYNASLALSSGRSFCLIKYIKVMKTDSMILNELMDIYPEARLLVESLRADFELPKGKAELILRVPNGDFRSAKTLYLTSVHGNLRVTKNRNGGITKKVQYYPSVVNLNTGYARAPELVNPIERDKDWNSNEVLRAIHYITNTKGGDLMIRIADSEALIKHLWILVMDKVRDSLDGIGV